MRKHGFVFMRGSNPPTSTYYDQGKFGRMFASLGEFAPDTPAVRQALMDIGAPGGIMDSQDDLSDPIKLITDPQLSLKNPNNNNISAGMTFIGQFLDHDMTFDPSSILERQQDPEAIENFRTPVLELDNIYGSGPGASPHLYDPDIDEGLTSFLVENNPGSEAVTRDGKLRYDLPRNSKNIALIGDPRNDENLIISQFHLAMLRFHNITVEWVKDNLDFKDPNQIFIESQRLVRWHYQWIIINDFLPRIAGEPVVKDILDNGRKWYDWRNAPYIPVEFSVGAYRFGHSQVRPSYRANFGPDDDHQFFGLIFDDKLKSSDDPDDLRGGKRAPRRFIDWQTFFDFGDRNVRPNKLIDTSLSSVLFDLTGLPKGMPQSLAQLNLLRNLALKVPSGQAVALAMGLQPLGLEDLDDLKPYSLQESTPLWFYVLREAAVQYGGVHLGDVGGRIVAEVFIGLLLGDRNSYLRQDPKWKPTLSATGDFTIVDLLKIAGVVDETVPAAPASGS